MRIQVNRDNGEYSYIPLYPITEICYLKSSSFGIFSPYQFFFVRPYISMKLYVRYLLSRTSCHFLRICMTSCRRLNWNAKYNKHNMPIIKQAKVNITHVVYMVLFLYLVVTQVCFHQTGYIV